MIDTLLKLSSNNREAEGDFASNLPPPRDSQLNSRLLQQGVATV
jgi:hypothetical protein